MDETQVLIQETLKLRASEVGISMPECIWETFTAMAVAAMEDVAKCRENPVVIAWHGAPEHDRAGLAVNLFEQMVKHWVKVIATRQAVFGAIARGDAGGEN